MPQQAAGFVPWAQPQASDPELDWLRKNNTQNAGLLAQPQAAPAPAPAQPAAPTPSQQTVGPTPWWRGILNWFGSRQIRSPLYPQTGQVYGRVGQNGEIIPINPANNPMSGTLPTATPAPNSPPVVTPTANNTTNDYYTAMQKLFGDKPTVITDEQGRSFWLDPNTGNWSIYNPGMTPEQQVANDQYNRLNQLSQIQLQYDLANRNQAEQSNLENARQAAQYDLMLRNQQDQYAKMLENLRAQYEMERQNQASAASQQMAQMYAADPYKYWAQMGQGTPEAVAALTGGRVQAGQTFQPGVPIGRPSAQWWNNLNPSEQQQVLGAVNWLGVNPEDWLSTYNRMIPGLSSRQVTPTWAR